MNAIAGTSIVIPAYNEGSFLPGLLRSIRQYGPPEAQVIVVDNGSTDDTAAVAAAHGAAVIRLDSKVFPSCARNFGVERSNPNAQLLVFLDADVELTAEWGREWRAKAASLRSEPMQITGDLYHVSKRPSWIERTWFARLRGRKPAYINGGNLITTRTAFDRVRGFDQRLETAEDVDFCARAARCGITIVLSDGFKVHHEGYPKTLALFVKRERWHGTGDFRSLQSVLKSKVALTTLAFVLLQVCALVALTSGLVTGVGYSVAAACGAAVVLLCLAGAVFKLPGSGSALLLQAVPVMYLYYLGRSFSAWDAMRRILPGSRKSARHHR